MILLKALPSLPREWGPETAERISVHLLKALGRLLRVPEHQTSWMENDGVEILETILLLSEVTGNTVLPAPLKSKRGLAQC